MNETGKIIGAMFIGALVGAALGVLFAPEKGSTTRSEIADGVKDLVNDLKKKMKEEAEDLVKKAEEVEDLAEDKAEEVVDSIKNKTKKATKSK